ncbi:MAG: hypothetical protein JNL28_03735 [Planctomycetes bacterium]|nr:hypothetical protein [Planctomycetota bacterium]
MRILMVIVGIIIGVVVGSAVMMGIHFASLQVYPLPEGIDLFSSEPDMRKRLVEWMATLPIGAWLWAWLAHAVGCLAGAVVAMFIAGRRSMLPALVVGAWFTFGGVLNAIQMEAPVWFYFIDWPIYLLGAYAVGKSLRRSPAQDDGGAGIPA